MRMRLLVVPVLVLLCSACSSTDWTESVLTFTGEEPGGDALLDSISGRLERALTPRGFTCESHEVMRQRGHVERYATCGIDDVSNPLQGTQTWVSVKRPDDVGSGRVQVHTGHVTAHPFTPSTRHFIRWAEVVKETLCGFPDFQVEHSWPADSEYPIAC